MGGAGLCRQGLGAVALRGMLLCRFLEPAPSLQLQGSAPPRQFSVVSEASRFVALNRSLAARRAGDAGACAEGDRLETLMLGLLCLSLTGWLRGRQAAGPHGCSPVVALVASLVLEMPLAGPSLLSGASGVSPTIGEAGPGGWGWRSLVSGGD